MCDGEREGGKKRVQYRKSESLLHTYVCVYKNAAPVAAALMGLGKVHTCSAACF